MNAAVAAAVANALALSRDMLAAAHAGDWEALAALEAQRLPLLRQHCTREQAGATVLEELRECNAQIVACVQGAREQVVRDWHAARAGHQGASDYQRIARDGNACLPPTPDSPGASR